MLLSLRICAMCMYAYAHEETMKIYGDYHTHTYASDGRATLKRQATAASLLGIREIAVTDHSFASTIFHMTRRKFEKQKEEAQSLDLPVKVLCGIEANLVNPQGDIDVPSDVIRECDVLVMGFHRYIGFKGEKRGGYARAWLFKNGFCGLEKRKELVEVNTAAYIEAMRKFPIDCIAHLNHRALVDVERVCEEAKKQGVYIELNEKHLDALERSVATLVKSGVNFIVGTDAHDAKKLGKMDKIAAFIEKYDLPRERVFGIDGRKPTFKDKKSFCE